MIFEEKILQPFNFQLSLDAIKRSVKPDSNKEVL
jgi:hypothetical protein